MANLVIPNSYFVKVISKSLADRDKYKMTEYLARQILLNNDRARFWGLWNCIDSALDSTGIEYKMDIDGNFTFYRPQIASYK